MTAIPAANHDDWIGLAEHPLDEAAVRRWLPLPRCGAVVTFSGIVRDHSEGQTGVTSIDYDAYNHGADLQMGAIVAQARKAWPDLGRIALIHRHGAVKLTDASVLVGVSSPHRQVAFTAARFLIDVLKLTVPVWKYEHGDSGDQWISTSVNADHVADVATQWLLAETER